MAEVDAALAAESVNVEVNVEMACVVLTLKAPAVNVRPVPAVYVPPPEY
jgi:hypothetical protein